MLVSEIYNYVGLIWKELGLLNLKVVFGLVSSVNLEALIVISAYLQAILVVERRNKLWYWNLNWRRWFEWELEQLQEFSQLINSVLYSNQLQDTWTWGHSSSGGFSVKSAYCVLSDSLQLLPSQPDLFSDLWLIAVPPSAYFPLETTSFSSLCLANQSKPTV
ncbi:hypothetical protein Fmac_027095 [Flemingia macrophylla]|uniref:Uncharacterized protein n=1 Tax=Flemingia macrophylla TaxID=520843 RepID=A0ABD1LH02_9FABA